MTAWTGSPHSSRTATPARRTLEKVLSVLIFALVLWQLYQSSKVGVTPRGTPAREALQHMHISVGVTLLALVMVRLWLWGVLPRPPRPARVPMTADALARHCNLAFYLTVLVQGVTGPMFAWSEAHSVTWFGLITLPKLVPTSYRIQVTLGYLHSAVGMWIMLLVAFSLLVSIWQAVRYRAPPWRMLPGFDWGR